MHFVRFIFFKNNLSLETDETYPLLVKKKLSFLVQIFASNLLVVNIFLKINLLHRKEKSNFMFQALKIGSNFNNKLKYFLAVTFYYILSQYILC